MRRFAIVLLVGACGRNDGVQLAISAPAIHGGGTLSIVLAQQKVTAVSDQRVSPASFTDAETVQYLVQQAAAGELALETFDGAVVQIEPGDEPGDYVPVLLERDDNGGLVAAGAVASADSGVPYAVPIVDGALTKAPLTLVPLTPLARAGGIDPGHSLAVACADTGQEPVTNGYAWRPPTGPELRLLLAQGSAEAASDTLDLDCDGVAADDADCDDANAAFYPDAPEACDRMDTNCDGEGQISIACGSQEGCAETQLCNDRTGATVQQCAPDPTCACDNAMNHCQLCELSVDDHASDSVGQPCSPSIGTVMLGMECAGEASCKVQAFGDASWDADLVDPTTHGFVDTITSAVPFDSVMLRVRHHGPPFANPDPGSIGGVQLLVTTPDGQLSIPIELFDDPTVRDGCDPSSTGNATTMLCEPVDGPL